MGVAINVAINYVGRVVVTWGFGGVGREGGLGNMDGQVKNVG